MHAVPCHLPLTSRQARPHLSRQALQVGQGRLCADEKVCCQRAAAGRVRDAVEARLRGAALH
jgi:hypothetical protein